MRRPVVYGGQAVIEGVMMRGPDRYAVAVRRPDAGIVVRQEPLAPLARRAPLFRLPILRGMAQLYDAFSIGIGALLWSASQAGDEGEELGAAEGALTVAVSLALAVGLFMALPTLAAGALRRAVGGTVGLNLIEAGIRIAVFFGYVLAISRMDDIRRVFQYHGAEHKVIHAYERGRPLEVGEVRAQSRFHPRCGTSFLLFLAVVTALIFSFFGWPVWWQRVLLRLALLPVVAGVAYEVLRFTARVAGAAGWLAAPGLWLQRLTTREPDDAQIEVALAAFRAVLPGGGEAHAG